MVHFSAEINGEHVEEIYSRCKSRLFVICYTRNIQKIFPTQEMKTKATPFVQITNINSKYEKKIAFYYYKNKYL
jgi:hypothetical protein